MYLGYVTNPERCAAVDGLQFEFSFMVAVQEIALKLKRSIERSLDDSSVSGVISLRTPTIFVVWGYLYIPYKSGGSRDHYSRFSVENVSRCYFFSQFCHEVRYIFEFASFDLRALQLFSQSIPDKSLHNFGEEYPNSLRAKFLALLCTV